MQEAQSNLKQLQDEITIKQGIIVHDGEIITKYRQQMHCINEITQQDFFPANVRDAEISARANAQGKGKADQGRKDPSGGQDSKGGKGGKKGKAPKVPKPRKGKPSQHAQYAQYAWHAQHALHAQGGPKRRGGN